MADEIKEDPRVIPLPETIYSKDMDHQMMIQAYQMRARGNTEDEIVSGLEIINLRCEPTQATDERLREYAGEAMRASPSEAQEEAEKLNRELRWMKEDSKPALVTTENGMIKTKEPPPALSIIHADELSQMDLQQPLFIVKDMIPQGLTLLASPPKYGKSWLMLDLCTSVAMGVPFLGRNTHQCHTLYLSLEDSKARLKDRITKVMRGRGDPPQGCMIATECMDIEHGLVQQLAGALDKDPELKLIIIDTFQKVRSGSKRNENDYAADYRESGAIKAIADKYGIGIILVTHLRKMQDPSDPFSNISGTTGLTGAADTMITLRRESRTDKNTIMSITGRDVVMDEFYLNFDNYRWKIRGRADDVLNDIEREAYNQDPIVITIKKLLEEKREENEDGWTGTASQFKEECVRFRQYTTFSPQGLRKEYNRLKEQLQKYDDIQWNYATHGKKGTTFHHFQYGYNPFEDEPQESEDSQDDDSQDPKFD